MVKSVDHESNTGSYVLVIVSLLIFLVLIPARFYLSPMATGRSMREDFLRVVSRSIINVITVPMSGGIPRAR